MPRGLVIGAVVAVIALVLLLSWLNERSLEEPAEPAADVAAPAPSAPTPVQRPAPPTAQGPVVLTATAPAWIQVTDQGKTLFSGELAPGQSFTVPPNATAPLLKAGKPEALRVNVGSAVAPAVGPAGKVASSVSLLPADLMRGPAAATPPAGQPPVAQPQANTAAR